jgi:tRNA dimethylallyltransferase
LAVSASPLIAVVGATAAGKSALALELALAVDGEVVNADSMQLYRGLDIGTAKLSESERRGVPHHLLDIWDVTQTASVAAYQRLADDAVEEITARGRTPIVVGGSGLYVRAVLDDLQFPGTDESVRARLEAELETVGAEAMHQRLRKVDPAAAAAILPRNGRRVVRALEVVEVTGRPFTATLPAYDYRRDTVQLGLSVPLPELDRRIEIRTDAMLAAGLVEEVRGLVTQGLREGRTASRALGYAQVLRYLDGDITETEARDEIVRATRRFARRQMSWFRRDPRVEWLPIDTASDERGEGIMERALGLLRRTIGE